MNNCNTILLSNQYAWRLTGGIAVLAAVIGLTILRADPTTRTSTEIGAAVQDRSPRAFTIDTSTWRVRELPEDDIRNSAKQRDARKRNLLGILNPRLLDEENNASKPTAELEAQHKAARMILSPLSSPDLTPEMTARRAAAVESILKPATVPAMDEMRSGGN